MTERFVAGLVGSIISCGIADRSQRPEAHIRTDTWNKLELAAVLSAKTLTMEKKAQRVKHHYLIFSKKEQILLFWGSLVILSVFMYININADMLDSEANNANKL